MRFDIDGRPGLTINNFSVLEAKVSRLGYLA